jgi:hypothetical protein
MCNACKDHTELGTQDDADWKRNLAEFPEPFCEFSSFASKCSGQKVKAKVHNEGIFEDGINHCSELSGRTAIPVCANVGEAKIFLKMSLCLKIKTLSEVHSKFWSVLLGLKTGNGGLDFSWRVFR